MRQQRAAMKMERTRGTALALAGVVGLGLTAAPAFGQSGTGRSLRISPQVRVVHDSNILRAPENFTLLPGRRRSDLIVSPTLVADIGLPFGRNRAFLSGQVGYDFHRYNKLLDRERIALDGGASVRLAGCEVTPSLSYSRAQTDLADLILVGNDLRNTQTRVAPAISVACGSSFGLSSQVGYQRETVRNSDPLRAIGNFRSSTYSARLGLARPALGNVSLFTTYRDGEYDNRVFGGGEREAVRSYAAGLELDRRIGSIQGNVSVGLSRVTSNVAGVSDFTGVSYSGSLSAPFAGRGRATLAFGRSVDQSNVIGASYGINDFIDGRLNYALTSAVQLNVGASRRTRRFDRSPLLGAGVGRFKDTTTDVTGGVSFVTTRRLALDLNATFRNRTADGPLFDYNARILSLTLRLN